MTKPTATATRRPSAGPTACCRRGTGTTTRPPAPAPCWPCPTCAARRRPTTSASPKPTKRKSWPPRRARGDLAASLPWHPFIGQQDFTPYFRQFEDPAELPRLLRWYEADRIDYRRRNGYLFDATHWMERALVLQPSPWPIAAHADWRVALLAAGMRAWGHQLAEVLAEVWQEEEQNRGPGLVRHGPEAVRSPPAIR